MSEGWNLFKEESEGGREKHSQLLSRVGSLGGLRGQGRIENKCKAVQEHVYLAMLSL